MDAFIKSFSELSQQLIPILGACALVCVIILLINLIRILCGFNVTVDKTNKTIDLVDESIDKIQAPLDTVVKVSHTVDKAHDATISAVTSAKNFVVKSAEEIKEKISSDSKEKIENEEDLYE